MNRYTDTDKNTRRKEPKNETPKAKRTPDALLGMELAKRITQGQVFNYDMV